MRLQLEFADYFRISAPKAEGLYEAILRESAAGLIGGFVQLAMGLLTRIVPTETGSAPPRFQGSMRLAFFAFNGGLTLWLYGAFTGGRLELVGLALLAASMMAFAGPLQKLMDKPSVASA